MRDGRAAHEQRVAHIYESYAPRIAAYALRRAASEEAADVVSETFLVAWRRSEAIPAEPDTLPWLYGVARRVLANQRRSRRRRGRLRDRLAREFEDHRPPESHLEATEEFTRVARALEHLPPDDAELLRLTAWEALTPADIATMLGIESNAARQRIHRARKRLRAQLASDGFDDSARPIVSVRLERCTGSPGARAIAPFAPLGPGEVFRRG